ncbi:hypothetical protein XENORESO_020457 [Xenotaenia resolanae]|uniref:Uncharacterized protein n=1 Tax=Xenotaenia resolanae TaxID=208358 RepID=A0ABV0WBQ2_9TELE
MRTKELSKKVRDKVVEKSGWGYKKISKSFMLSHAPSAPSSLNGKTWYHQKPAKRGLPTKTHIPGKEGINQRGSTETKGNSAGVAEFQRRVSVHGTTISHTVHRSGFMEEWPQWQDVARSYKLIQSD